MDTMTTHTQEALVHAILTRVCKAVLGYVLMAVCTWVFFRVPWPFKTAVPTLLRRPMTKSVLCVGAARFACMPLLGFEPMTFGCLATALCFDAALHAVGPCVNVPQSMPTTAVVPVDDDDQETAEISKLQLQCLICLQPAERPVFVSPTGTFVKHVYHPKCINTWLNIRPVDPTTRLVVAKTDVHRVRLEHVADLMRETVKVWDMSGEVVYEGPTQELVAASVPEFPAGFKWRELWMASNDCTGARWTELLAEVQREWPRVQPVCEGLNRLTAAAGCVQVAGLHAGSLNSPARLLLVEDLTITHDEGKDVLLTGTHWPQPLPEEPAFLERVTCSRPFMLRLFSDDGSMVLPMVTPDFELGGVDKEVQHAVTFHGSEFRTGCAEGTYFVDIYPGKHKCFCSHAKRRRVVLQTDEVFATVHLRGQHVHNKSAGARQKTLRRLRRARSLDI